MYVDSDSATICGDDIDILGRWDGHMYTSSLSTLLKSCRNLCPPETEKISAYTLPVPASSSVWNRAQDLPVTQSTCVTVKGRVLAIGGIHCDHSTTIDVHVYEPATNTWEVISHMLTTRADCFAAVLPGNQLMVVGSKGDSQIRDSVEVAATVL